jgi:hypothetical protein
MPKSAGTPQAEAERMRIKVEISPGELVDRLTILEIKQERIADPSKLENVRRDYAALRDAAGAQLDRIAGLAALAAELKAVNGTLWNIEDDIRVHEARGDFGASFVALARSVYRTNDRRAALKRRINDLAGSDIPEEKSYRSHAPGDA